MGRRRRRRPEGPPFGRRARRHGRPQPDRSGERQQNGRRQAPREHSQRVKDPEDGGQRAVARARERRAVTWTATPRRARSWRAAMGGRARSSGRRASRGCVPTRSPTPSWSACGSSPGVVRLPRAAMWIHSSSRSLFAIAPQSSSPSPIRASAGITNPRLRGCQSSDPRTPRSRSGCPRKMPPAVRVRCTVRETRPSRFIRQTAMPRSRAVTTAITPACVQHSVGASRPENAASPSMPQA